MTDLNDHCRVVLSAVIPDRVDLLVLAQSALSKDHFLDSTLKNIFVLLERYLDVTGGILTRDAVEDSLKSRIDAGRLALYLETYDSLLEATPLDSDFKWSLAQIRELVAERHTNEALVKGMEIFRTGFLTPKNKLLKGHEDARSFVLESFGQIDRDLTLQTAPEGDLGASGATLLASYQERKATHGKGLSPGILLGIPDVDSKTGGFNAGEVGIICAWSGSGKSHCCINLSYHAAVEQGKNVVYFTTETSKDVIDRRMLARHSRHPQFELREGINSRDIKQGTIPTVHEPVFNDIIRDLEANQYYGRVYTSQVPNNCTIAGIEQRLYRIQRQFNIDLVVIDYLPLLRSETRRQSGREDYNEILRDAKQLATTFDNGRGLPVISPWQVSRTSWEEALKSGYYTLKALAETSEAANIADVVMTLLAPVDNDPRYTELKSQILKNRDGETASGITISVDYATSYFTSGRINQVQQFNGLADLNGEEDLSFLLGDNA